MATKTAPRPKAKTPKTPKAPKQPKAPEVTPPTTTLAQTEIDQDQLWAHFPVYDTKSVAATEVKVKTNQSNRLDLMLNDTSLGELTENALRQLGWAANFKSDFLPKLSPELRQEVVNFRLSDTKGKFQVIAANGKLTSFAPGWRSVIKPALVTQVIYNELAKHFGESVSLAYHKVTENSLKLRFMTDIQDVVTPAVGDILSYGVEIVYEPAREIIVALYSERLICLNGAKTSEVAFKWTSQKSATEEDQLVFLSNACVKAIEAHETMTAHAKEMAQTNFEGDASVILRERANSLGLSAHADSIISMFEQEPGETEWHLFNALTRHATHSTKLDDDQKSRLQLIAGDLLTNYDVVTAELPRNIARKVGARILNTEAANN